MEAQAQLDGEPPSGNDQDVYEGGITFSPPEELPEREDARAGPVGGQARIYDVANPGDRSKNPYGNSAACEYSYEADNVALETENHQLRELLEAVIGQVSRETGSQGAGHPPGPEGQGVPSGSGYGGATTAPARSSGPAPATGASGTGSQALDPMEVLMKSMTQLQQAYLGRPEGDVKSSVDLPMMPAVGQDSAVEFADWVYEAEQIIGSLSDKASLWFSACLEVARTTYDQYNAASPLQRLSLMPVIPEELRDPRWSRLERKVMTLLLGALQKTAKEEVITHRISTVAELLFRMYVLYQPGGTAERSTILKHLEGQTGTEDVHACIAQLRRWRRYLQRAEDIGIAIPDASVLLKGVERLTTKVLDANADVKFRVALTKNELQLHSRPDHNGVLRYHNAILAELQTMAPTRTSPTAPSGGTEAAKLKNINAAGDAAGGLSPPSPQPKTRATTPSRFFLTDAGCTRGSSCTFSHNFNKKEKAGRCWLTEGTSGGTTCGFNGDSYADLIFYYPTLGSNFVASGVENATVAHKCHPQTGRTGLLDSGASHAFRTGTDEELRQADRVTVQLATGSEVTLAQNKGGTLLSVPAKGNEDVSPIVPLGSLVQDLGCDLQWTRRRGLEIRHPQFGLIRPQVVGSCPLIGEACALVLIRELEEHKVRNLRESVRNTQKSLWMWNQEKPWARHLEEFLGSGRRADQLSALSSEDSPFASLTEAERSALAEQVELTDKAGWNYLKAIPCSRQRRKRMMTMPWILHLYAGDGRGADPVFKVLEDSRVVVEVDIAKSLAYDLFKVSGVYRCLLWAAATGRLDGILGAPPARTEADAQLLLKQLWLFTVAKAARASSSGAPVFMVLEGSRVQKVIKATEFSRWPTVRASWGTVLDQLCLEEIDSNLVTNMVIPEPYPDTGDSSTKWTKEFKEVLVKAMELWWKAPEGLQVARWMKRLDADPKKFLEGLSNEELQRWKTHVVNNHQPYDRRCKTCVTAKGTGRLHKRIRHPDVHCLSLDVVGPFRTKSVDPNHNDYRYFLVGAYTMPEPEEDFKADGPPDEPCEGPKPDGPPDEPGEDPKPDGPPDEPREDPKPDGPSDDDGGGVGPVDCGDDGDPDLKGLTEEEFAKIFSEEENVCASLGYGAEHGVYAAAAQRARVLGVDAPPLPYGAKIHLRSKTYGKNQDPGSWDLRWRSGFYMGPSLDVQGGHVVRFEDGTYTTTKHVRPGLIDSDRIVDLGMYEAVIPVPARRYRRKTTLDEEPVDPEEEMVGPYDPNHPAEHYAMGLLDEDVLVPDQLETLVHLLPTTAPVPRRFGEQNEEKKLWTAGAFVHGGVLGVKRATTTFPMSTRVFTKYIKQIAPGFAFNAVAVNVDILTQEHKDVHNVGKSMITAISSFSGGEIVTEGDEGEVTVPLTHGPTYFEPHKKHRTSPWKDGQRMVLVGYSIRDSGRLSDEHVAMLRHYGFEWEPHFRAVEPAAGASLKAIKVREISPEVQHGPEEVMDPITPTLRRRTLEQPRVQYSPGASSQAPSTPNVLDEDVSERARVSRDLLALLTVEELKVGLRYGAQKHTSEWCAWATVSRQWCKVLKCLDIAPLAWRGIQALNHFKFSVVRKPGCGRKRRLLQGISIWGPGRSPPRPNGLKMCLRELSTFLAFEAHWIGRRRRRWGRSSRWKMQAGGWYRVRFLLRWRALRRHRPAGDGGAQVPTLPPDGDSCRGGTPLGRGKLLEIDRMAGGGDAFLDGLMHFCATFRAQHDGDRELTRQVKAVEQIVARAQKQPGYDFLDGLQAFIEKERKNKAGQRGEPMSRAQVRTVQMLSDAEERPRQRQWPNSGHDNGWTKNRGANWWPRQGAGRPDVSEGSWTSLTWKPRVGDWESAQSTNIHVIEGSVAFAKALDDHKDEPFLVIATDAEDFDVCVGMAEGERNAMATILLPCAAHWPEERSKPATVRVPGMLNRALQMRLCFCKSFCEGAPQLSTKKVIKPAKVQAFKPDATRRDGFVLRFICPWVYQQSGDQDWKRMIANPGAAARTWASQLSNLGTCLGDSFRFEIRDENSRHAQLRGLLRVHTAEAALKLLQLSGSLDDKGRRWFTEPVHGDLGDKVPAAVLWIDWQDGERWQAYASRVARLGDTGLVLGRMQLGTRVHANDRRLKDRPSTWRVTNTPHMWTGDMVCDVLQTLGFRDVEVLQKLHRGATAHWVIKGIPPSLTELYQPTVADGAGKEHELVVIKEARRRRQDNNGHGLRSEHAVSYTPVVKPLRKDKRGSQVRQADGQGDAPMTGQDGANAAEAAKKAKTQSAPPQSKVKSPWLPEGAQRVQNTGKGDCLFLAIADALKVLDPSKNASGRSLRAFIVAWYTRHLEEYQSLWDGLKAGVVSREANGNWNGSFEDYIADIKMAGVWGCYLELVTLFEHGGTEKAICLYFDREVQHYEYLAGDIQDQLAFWATAHAGGRDASRDSGGGRGMKSTRTEGPLKLEDFASQASGSTVTRRGPRLVEFASHAGSSAIRSGSKAFIQEDLQKYYDTIHFPLAALVLERLGMPVQVVALLKSFYSRQFRLLSFRGQCSSQWILATRGLVQGCPMSPVIAAAIMHIWQLTVSSARVSSLAYQDDRTLILKPDVSQMRGTVMDLQPLADACQRSRAFDAAFEFSCDSTKSAVIGDDRCQGLADNLGYPREENLSLLGVCHPLNPRAPRRLLHFTVDKLKARMKFIPAAVVHPRLVILHLRSLPSADELASVTSGVKASFGKNLTFEAPPCLVHEECGWLTEPSFCADWALLQQAHRLHCSPPPWLELLPLSEACAPWFRVLPLATKVLQRLGWTVSGNGGVIYRRDNALRMREYRMGFDSLQVLKEWLLLHYRRRYLSRCGRVVKSLHRQGPNLAQGADLPAPAAGAFIRAAGHVATWSKNPPVPLKRAALATGGSVWHFGPRFGPWAAQQPPQCLCGLNKPSRVHLTFHCPVTRDLRDGMLAPATRIQERLFAMEGEEIPPAPATPDMSALVAEWCTALPVLTGSIVAATDGGAKDLVAASGIFLPQLSFIKACAVPGEDQSNYKAEIFALWLLLSLLVSARRRRLVAIHVLVDCEAAILAVEGQGNELPCLIRCIRSLRRCLQQDGTDVHLHWVPSHGKRPRRWRPWSDLAPAIQQQYNDTIDAAVTECLAQRLQGSLRSSFLRRAEAAQRWEERVIAVSAAAGLRFADSVSA
ncbi:unnamed protein product [Symbiodinium sp. CCMP2592]|nr:unnamed protein product [Symbiodinium sp. CCMP2592]